MGIKKGWIGTHLTGSEAHVGEADGPLVHGQILHLTSAHNKSRNPKPLYPSEISPKTVSTFIKVYTVGHGMVDSILKAKSGFQLETNSEL